MTACLGEDGFSELPDALVAPPLMWSEARSAIHELVWRGAIRPDRGERAHARLAAAPVQRGEHERLGEEAWRVADELGWAKTYDAEYVALALLLGCRVVTIDGRLRRSADRLGVVVGPSEL